MMPKPTKTNQQIDIYRWAAEIQQRMYDEWDEEAIDRIAEKLIEDEKT